MKIIDNIICGSMGNGSFSSCNYWNCHFPIDLLHNYTYVDSWYVTSNQYTHNGNFVSNHVCVIICCGWFSWVKGAHENILAQNFITICIICIIIMYDSRNWHGKNGYWILWYFFEWLLIILSMNIIARRACPLFQCSTF